METPSSQQPEDVHIPMLKILRKRTKYGDMVTGVYVDGNMWPTMNISTEADSGDQGIVVVTLKFNAMVDVIEDGAFGGQA